MRLSSKTGLIVTMALVVAFGATFTTAGIIILDDHRHIEVQDAQTALAAVQANIDQDLVELEGTAAEFIQITMTLLASGDIEGGNNTTQLGAALFAANDIDFIFMQATDPTTGTAFAGGFRIANGAFQNIDDATNASLQASSFLTQPVGSMGASGAISLAGQPFLVAAQPLAIPGLAGMDGLMLVARAVDADYVGDLSVATQESIQVTDAPGSFTLRRDGLRDLEAGQPVIGPDGPAFGIQVQQNRDAYLAGLSTFFAFLGAAAVASAGILVLTLYLLRRFVVLRIRDLSHRMTRLREGDRLDARVQLDGDDELSDMAASFDDLMETLEQRTRRLDRFASVISHDLQSPLSTFKLNLALLRSKAQHHDDDASLAQLARMERTCDHMQRRIRAVLDYARDAEDPKLTPLDLGELINEVRSDMAAELERADAEIRIGAMPRVQADREQVGQVIQNLLQNAIKYRKSGQPAKVQIRARRRKGRWHIQVQDQGRGIDDGDAPRMVMPFSRLASAGEEEGHGIGLSICAELVARHGGTMTIRGRRGVGATIGFDLPAVPRKKRATPAARPTPNTTKPTDGWSSGSSIHGASGHAMAMRSGRPQRPRRPQP